MERQNRSRRAKVDLIDGFLGAGKTTLIRRYRAHLEKCGITYAVLENEFGVAGVDAQLLGGDVRELTGGCICCGQKVAFHDWLIETATQVERIVVEPSGLFNADDFFDVLDSPRAQDVAECGMMACVVDPFSLDEMSEEELKVLYSELIPAGAALLSRSDRADEATMRKAAERLREMVGEIPVFDARKVDFERLMQCEPVRRAHERVRGDHATMFQSATLFPEIEYDERRLRRAIERILSGEAGDVARVKGTVRASDGFWLVNATRTDVEIRRGGERTALNVIGRGLKRKELRKIMTSNTQEDSPA